ncbi:DNA repair protein rhp54-like [Arachis ipaensis]|uniref:DNA repair protein rhp54-like n=1 Tax=Arachis ipaensis TaxID=130454 RepID=UPI000A2B3584|nr:DNA repair protein rhp54-like [Arachis ipaensis]XP_025679760.1 DNA repair protein rhp54 isoform X2 [Arachis hypogaea]XP_025679761.1 DNA repair protein rhp54 isoform X2 [Arachis hypogaea]
MLQPEVKSQAMEVAKLIKDEDGVTAAVDAFHRHLPSELPLPTPSPVEDHPNALQWFFSSNIQVVLCALWWCIVFFSPLSKVLIVLYETFRMHSSKFSSSGSRDLLICDEAHRLKNDQTITNRALAALPCKRRILFSGTPLQNDLEEFCGS